MSDLNGPETNQEIEPVNPPFKLVLQFEKHNFPDWKGTQSEENLATYDNLVSQEATTMRRVFVKDQKNILLVEAAHENTEFRRLFAQTYDSTHSALSAQVFASFVVNYHREPSSQEEFQAVADYVFEHLEGDDFYDWAIFEAVDFLNKEGFEINLVKEKYTDIPTVNSQDGLAILANLANKIIKRNNTIKDQIIGFAQQANTDKVPTHMLVILGLLHNELIEVLPESILQNTYATTEFDPQRIHPELISLVDQTVRLHRSEQKGK